MLPTVLPLKTARNPRDLGGYQGFNNHKVKSRRLLRTGEINNLSVADMTFLQKYGLSKIIDLRSRSESSENPDPQVADVEYFSLPLSAENGTLGDKKDLFIKSIAYNQDQYAAFKMKCGYYRDHVLKKHDQEIVSEILNILADTESGAILYHCSEGQDRTGYVTLFILYLLGVDLEVIRQDYLFSNYLLNTYRAVRDQSFLNDGKSLKFRANMRILSSVSNAYFDTVLITIKDEFGGIENYVKEQLHVTPELKLRLRELYLEK